MENIPNPHDRLFKEVFSRRDAARDFLLHYLPSDLLQSMDLDTLEILIRCVFNAADGITVEGLGKMVSTSLTKDKEEVVMTLAERLIKASGNQRGGEDFQKH